MQNLYLFSIKNKIDLQSNHNLFKSNLFYECCFIVNNKIILFNNKNCFLKHVRSEIDFKSVLGLIKKYDIINDCYLKAEYFIGLSSNSLSIFPDTKEKEILKK